MMLLEVRREVIPIGISGQWEQRPYSQIVWKHDGGDAQAFPIKVPHDFMLGVLAPYIDGAKVSLPIFDAALEMVGCTRREIERALAAVDEPAGQHR